MSTDICAACSEPLLLEVEPDSDFEDEASSVPDDVELNCHCHFHWECFLDSYNITECPSCTKDVSSLSSTGQQQVLCIVRNEGGLQKDFDILPSATEEAYLRTYPEERISHAYLEFCREGDLDALVHLIRDAAEDDADEETEKLDLLRYQGTFEGIEGSGLHVAIRNQQIEVAWLLLILGSSLEWSKFPPAVIQAMNDFGLEKSDRQASLDIRTLKDSEGRTPAALAREIGGPWVEWLENGLLTP